MALFGRHLQLGFWLTDEALEAALIQPRRKGWKLLGQSVAKGEALLVPNGRRERLATAFQTAMKALPRVARRADMPAVLSVPEALVEEEVLAFAEFPSSKREAKALVSQRLARELGAVADDLAVSWETFAPANGEVTCRARAMSRSLRADIEAGAASAGLRLVRIDGWSGFASGAPELGAEPSGAAVWSDGTDWSLLCWQEGFPAGFCQSGRSTDTDELAATVARLSLSFAKSAGAGPGKLFVSVPGTMIQPLKTAATRLGLSVFEFAAGDNRAAQVAAWA